jgi:hypothetical protein
MNRRKFLVGCLCACPTAAFAQEVTVGGKSYPSRKAFVARGLRCGTPVPSAYERGYATRSIRGLRAARYAADDPFTVPVRCNVIHDGNDGKLATGQVEEQVVVLNRAFTPTRIGFNLIDLRFHNKPDWFNMGWGSDVERQMKAGLGRQQARSLNLYILAPRNGFLGWATFPWNFREAPTMDGVVLAHGSMPGSKGDTYNLGMTAVHEVGHWLGLMHTFEGGCADPGDSVDDTPAEEGADDCDVGRDTCPALPGNDPVQNYMNYTPDACMTGFSQGQVRRMRDLTLLHRRDLLESGPAIAMRGAAKGKPKWDPSVLRQILAEAQ